MREIKASRFDATTVLTGQPQPLPVAVIPPTQTESKPADDTARREMRWKNRTLDTLTVLSRLKEEMPEVWRISKVVGCWVWIEFPMKPAQPVREALCDMGFIWNRKRGAWQHACGAFAHHAKHDPRYQYGEIPASEMTEDNANAVAA